MTQLSDEAKLRQEVIQSLQDPCARATYGLRQREAAEKLGKSVRTVRRLVKQWEKEGLPALIADARADKGKHRIDEDWQKFIIKTYKEGNKGSKRMTPNQVAIRVQAQASELGQEKYPSYRTVYRILQPIIEKQEQTQSVRSRGLERYAGESVVLRFDPRDITTVWVYRKVGEKEEFCARAYATDLEAEQLSMEEAKTSSRKIRNAGKTVGNRSILEEVRDRDTFVSQKKSRKERQKEEQALVGTRTKQPFPIAPEEVKAASAEPEPEMPEVFYLDDLQEDYGL